MAQNRKINSKDERIKGFYPKSMQEINHKIFIRQWQIELKKKQYIRISAGPTDTSDLVILMMLYQSFCQASNSKT